MNPSEITFLILGLVVGAASGVALWQAVRSPSAAREVRLTIAPNAIPARRAATLAIPGGSRYPGPLPGSPDGDASTMARPVSTRPAAALAVAAPVTARAWSGGTTVRTPVPDQPVSIPVDAVAVPVVVEDVEAFAPGPSRAVAARTVTSAGALLAGPSALAVAVLDPPTAPAGAPVAVAGDAGQAGDPGPGDASGLPAIEACADERRLVAERCAVADVAREEARRTADALRDAQHAYDALQERVERAREVADPRHVADAKNHLHAAFRTATNGSATPDEAEAAAREWLDAINRLNAAVRDATRLAELGAADLRAQLATLDRLGLEADAARIAAENAAGACHAARERLAACEEAEVLAAAAAAAPAEPEDEHPLARFWPAEEPTLAQPPAADELAGVSSIIRVLRGDRAARERIVAALAGDDAEAQREWHLRLAQLVDAITARAIEDGYLDLPADDPFWGMFEAREARDIVNAMSALGFRFDGMGGFADDRVPAARDLSLAVGYAGLDRMRIRTWPQEESLGALFSRATVTADEWLVDEAGDLALGRMVDALGSRAASLADTWNAWGRVRPVLLAE